LMGFPKEEAAAPGRPFSICVENWIVPIFRPGRGVTFPSNNASMTSGREGRGDGVAVAEATGVAVSTKLVAGMVGVSNGTAVPVVSKDGWGDSALANDSAGTSSCVN